MEVTKVLLDDGTGTKFDAALSDTLPDGGDLAIITKDAGTEEGRACVLLTFSVEVNGKLRKAQTVVTMRNFLDAAKILGVRYTEEGFRK